MCVYRDERMREDAHRGRVYVCVYKRECMRVYTSTWIYTGLKKTMLKLPLNGPSIPYHATHMLNNSGNKKTWSSIPFYEGIAASLVRPLPTHCHVGPSCRCTTASPPLRDACAGSWVV